MLWLAVLALAVVLVVFALGMFAGCWLCLWLDSRPAWDVREIIQLGDDHG